MEIGDYAYIKGISRDYGIGKITQLNSGYSSNGGELIDIQFKHSKHSIPKKDIISSPRIIDLIEVGDYVNGKRVNFVYNPDGKQVFRIEFDVDGLKGHMICESKHIKSILTKEQFEQMEYKID